MAKKENASFEGEKQRTPVRFKELDAELKKAQDTIAELQEKVQECWILGLGGIDIPASADLDDYTEIGNYCCRSNATVATLTNTPTDTAFTMKVSYGTGHGYIKQDIYAHTGGHHWTRTYSDYYNAWSAWVGEYTSAEVDAKISSVSNGINNKMEAHLAERHQGTLVGQSSNGTECTDTPWFKVAEVTLSGTNLDTGMILCVNMSWSGFYCGILAVKLRSGSSSASNSAVCSWLARKGLAVDDFVLIYNSDVNAAKAELWCKVTAAWTGYNFTVLSQNTRSERYTKQWQFVSPGLTKGGVASYTSGMTAVVSSDYA